MMTLINNIKNYFNKLIDRHNLRRHIIEKADRIVLYNAASTITNFLFALLKIVVGLLFWSLWFMIFGGYYVLLLAIRSYFLWRYQQVRMSALSLTQRKIIETKYLREGGFFYALLGAALVVLSAYMYYRGQPQHYNQSIVLLIALIGFVKIGTSIAGWIRARHFHSPIITFLKSLNFADGLVAIVMTQYALLAYEKSPQASSSTGLFGAVIGCMLVLLGLSISLKAHLKIRSESSHKL